MHLNGKSMKIDHDWIASHIPHQGSMSLLDHVASWDAERLTAIATSHIALDNPLRAHGRLGAANGIEYAAQAMAVHSALLATSHIETTSMARPQAGFLASVRNTALHVSRLDDLTEALRIEVVCTHAEPNCILYQFTIRTIDTQRPLLDGRATVIIDVAMVINNTGTSI
jgi:predicted hotdog family 3-hydroxylacyl-ACP dehydratase